MRGHKLGTVLALALGAALVFATVAVAATIRGTQGDDNNLMGTAGQDKIIAKKGNDTANGLGEADRLSGGRGTDTLNGGDGDDSAWGGADDDTLNGELGNDSLRGKDGNDTLNGADGNDFLNGGKGVDTVDGGIGDDTVFSRGDGKAADNITCGDGTNDTVKADANDVVDADCEIVDRTGPGTKPPKPPKP
jgi:Ca2+-binding RTX toxin-like protein